MRLNDVDAVVGELTKPGGGHIEIIREKVPERDPVDTAENDQDRVVTIKTIGKLEPSAIQALILPNEQYIASHKNRARVMEESMDWDDPEQVDGLLRARINILEHESIVQAYRKGDYWVYENPGDTIADHPDLDIWFGNRTTMNGRPVFAAVFVRKAERSKLLKELDEQIKINHGNIIEKRIALWNSKKLEDRKRIVEEYGVATRESKKAYAALMVAGRDTMEGRKISRKLRELKKIVKQIPDGIKVDKVTLRASAR